MINYNLTHYDILAKYQTEIEKLFQSFSSEMPDLHELECSNEFTKCNTTSKEFKNKTAYICNLTTSAKGYPKVLISITSFAHGGMTNTFNSSNFYQDNKFISSQKSNYEDKEKKQLIIKNKKLDEECKRHRFINNLNNWQNSDLKVADHPYIVNKQISQLENIKRLNYRNIGFILQDIHGVTKGIQTINCNGLKLIYGEKKGNFSAIGNYKKAKNLYFCEGYATGNAIYEILIKLKKAKNCCVIIAIDVHNLSAVVENFYKLYFDKIFIICPDNDYKKLPAKENIGMLRGYKTAINFKTLIKAIPENEFKGSDWCDAWIEDKNKSLKYFKKEEKNNYLEYSYKALLCLPQNCSKSKLTQSIVECLKVAYQYVPIRYSEKEIIQNICKKIQHINICGEFTEDIIKGKLAQKEQQKLNKYVSIKSLTSIKKTYFSNNNLTFDTIKIKNTEELPTIMKALKESFESEAHKKLYIFILKAPLGSGKTKNFIKTNFEESKNNNKIQPIAITAHKSLVKQLSVNLGAKHYIEDKNELINKIIKFPLAVTINSLPKFHNGALYKNQEVFIDEYSQVIQSITSGTVKNNERKYVYDSLMGAIKNSKYTYIADADFSDVHLKNLKLEMSKCDREVEIINLIMDEKLKNKEYCYYMDNDPYICKKYMIDDVKKALKNKQKCCIISDSKQYLFIVKKALYKYGCDKVLIITQETIGNKKQQEFLISPDKYLIKNKPEVVLISPSIQSGVSIESNYFARVFASYAKVVTPLVFRQMLHRVRAINKFEIFLGNGSSKKYVSQRTTISKCIMEDYFTQYKIQNNVSNSVYDLMTDSYNIAGFKITQSEKITNIRGSFKNKNLNFELLSADLQSIYNIQMNNAENALLLQAIDDGIKITRREKKLNVKEKKIIRKNYKEIKTEVKEELNKNIIQANNIEENKYKENKYNNSKNITTDEFYEIEKFEISKKLNKDISTIDDEDIDFYSNNGCPYVKNFNDLKLNEEITKKRDKEDFENGISVMNARWHHAKFLLLKNLFALLNINISNGKGIYGVKEAKKLKLFINNNEEVRLYIIHKLNLNPKSNISDLSIANKIFNNLLGLKCDRYQKRDAERKKINSFYEIREISFNRLMKYYKLYIDPVRKIVYRDNILSQ